MSRRQRIRRTRRTPEHTLAPEQVDDGHAPQQTADSRTVSPQQSMLQLQRTIGNHYVTQLMGVAQRDVDGPYGTYTTNTMNDQQDQINQLTGIDPNQPQDLMEMLEAVESGVRHYVHLSDQKILDDNKPFDPEMKRGRKFYQGWKVHVGVKPDEAAQLLQVVLPLLQELQVKHKIVDKLETYTTDDRVQNLGKYVTVYAKNLREAKTIMAQLTFALKGNFTPLTPQEQSPDFQFSDTGLVSTRYGSFNDPNQLQGPTGPERDDRTRSHPDWMQEEFEIIKQYSEEITHIINQPTGTHKGYKGSKK